MQPTLGTFSTSISGVNLTRQTDNICQFSFGIFKIGFSLLTTEMLTIDPV
jgi:hypothetical protein